MGKRRPVLTDFQQRIAEIAENSSNAQARPGDLRAFQSTCQSLQENTTDENLQQAQEDLKILKSGDPQKIEETFRKWSAQGDEAASTTLLAYIHFRETGANEETLNKVLTAAALADIENKENAFHNNDHFRRVAMMSLLLTDDKSPEQTDVFVGACVHDLFHPGRKNEHTCEIEHASFGRAAPFLQRAGMTNPELKNLRAMMTATDVSDVPEYTPQQAARDMFDRKTHKIDSDWPVAVTEDLEMLQKDKNLLKRAIILRESDILPTALTATLAVEGGVDVHMEADGDGNIQPGFSQFFLQNIVGEMQSDKAKQLANSSLRSTNAIVNGAVENNTWPEHIQSIIDSRVAHHQERDF